MYEKYLVQNKWVATTYLNRLDRCAGNYEGA